MPWKYLVINGFPHKGRVMSGFNNFCYQPAQAVEQKVDFAELWGDVILMWHHCNMKGKRNSMQELEVCLPTNIPCSNLTGMKTSRMNRTLWKHVNTLGPRQNGHHFIDDTIKHIFLNENVRISIEISLKFVPKGPVNNIPALIQITAWRRPGDKPLSETMMIRILMHICVTRPQWVN